MNICKDCVFCVIGKQKKATDEHIDSPDCEKFLQDMLDFLSKNTFSHTTGWLSKKLEEIYEDYFGVQDDFPAIKHKYNQLLLKQQDQFLEKIKNSEDKIKTCINYACAGNYIDFGALDSVSDEKLSELIEREAPVDEKELQRFREDLAKAKTLVYVTDNCGEVVMDKLFMETIKSLYPELKITALLRGGLTGNDATLEDAEEIGLTGIVECVGNGSTVYGTDLSDISKEANELLHSADVIIAKGQANFETLHREGINPYYLFICKCQHFMEYFDVPLFSNIFVREDELEGRD
ncbi:MAG: ARMT1-like domain-containing protein [Eubacteriales bacterium]|nr:ARMT1-like domain-containing protein [Eubacteriales bacterium]